MERLVRFTFLGQEYKVYTGTSEEDMGKILDFIHRAEEEIRSEGGDKLPAGKTAVMITLNIASEYIRLRQELDQYKVDMEKRIASLNNQIDSGLFQENSG